MPAGISWFPSLSMTAPGRNLLRISRERLFADAAQTGYRPEIVEKVIRLFALLEGIRKHPYLRERLVLKGGTALNLFMLSLPRLSVDIDLNYIGAASRETMLAERPKVDQAIRAICGREGLAVERMPDDHAVNGDSTSAVVKSLPCRFLEKSDRARRFPMRECWRIHPTESTGISDT